MKPEHMTGMQQYKILVVDNDECVCRLLCDLFKSQGYNVCKAHNVNEALEQTELFVPDMVISEITLPDMDGFQLTSILKERYPRIKCILMTNCDIDQYLSLIRHYNVGNIIIKGFEYSLGELRDYVNTLIQGNIFGLQKYFPDHEIQQVRVTRYAETKDICSTICNHFNNKKRVYLEMAIDELVSNAVFHGVFQLTHIPRELWKDDLVISNEESVIVSWARDDQKIGIAVEDPKGTLKKNDVLKWIDATYKRDFGEHGRGFLLVRKLIDRLIINIDPGKKTECIIIQYVNSNILNAKKPLMIHEFNT
jgi:CheY-like chemotaxis protein/anti-sigma regulatory factor (Ser/Thr protein kinase)